MLRCASLLILHGEVLDSEQVLALAIENERAHSLTSQGVTVERSRLFTFI